MSSLPHEADPYAIEAEIRAAGLIPSDTDERWADVDRRAPWTLPDGGAIIVASNVPGTGDHRDLPRSARTVQLDDGTSIRVAHRGISCVWPTPRTAR